MKIRKPVLIVFLLGIPLAIYLGFANIVVSNDKLLHFTVFFILTCLFYWIFDASNTRTIRNLTFMICTLTAGIGSELLQILLPYRNFNVRDIIANILGSLSALVLSVFKHKELLERRRDERYEQLISSIPNRNDDVDFDRDLESGFPSHNDLSRFTSTVNISLKNVDSEPINDLRVD